MDRDSIIESLLGIGGYEKEALEEMGTIDMYYMLMDELDRQEE